MREFNDCTFTPPDTIDEFLASINLPTNLKVLDPAVGAGAFLHRLKAYGFTDLKGVEVDPTHKNELLGWDIDYESFIRTDKYANQYDLVITNPPYSKIEDFVRKGVAALKPCGLLYYLLRVSALTGVKTRSALLQEHKPYRVTLLNRRPKFPGWGNLDSCGYCWVSWRKQNSPEETKLTWL